MKLLLTRSSRDLNYWNCNSRTVSTLCSHWRLVFQHPCTRRPWFLELDEQWALKIARGSAPTTFPINFHPTHPDFNVQFTVCILYVLRRCIFLHADRNGLVGCRPTYFSLGFAPARWRFTTFLTTTITPIWCMLVLTITLSLTTQVTVHLQ